MRNMKFVAGPALRIRIRAILGVSDAPLRAVRWASGAVVLENNSSTSRNVSKILQVVLAENNNEGGLTTLQTPGSGTGGLHQLWRLFRKSGEP